MLKSLRLYLRLVESSSLDSSFSSQRPCLAGLLFLLCFASWRYSAAIPTLSYHIHSFWRGQNFLQEEEEEEEEEASTRGFR